MHPEEITLAIDEIDISEFAGQPCCMSAELVCTARYLRSDHEWEITASRLENVRLYDADGEPLGAAGTALILEEPCGHWTIRRALTALVVERYHDDLICRAREFPLPC